MKPGAVHTYDPFGAPLDTPPANATAHRYTGAWDKQYDSTNGLVLMGARLYDPGLGRFLTTDPIQGGSLNNYDYAGQDPINGYDLSGRSWWCKSDTRRCKHKDDGADLSSCWSGDSSPTGWWCYTGENRSTADDKNGVSYKYTVTATPQGGDYPAASAGYRTVVYKNGTVVVTGYHMGHETALGIACTASDGPTPFSKTRLLNPSVLSQVISDVASALACPDPAR